MLPSGGPEPALMRRNVVLTECACVSSNATLSCSKVSLMATSTSSGRRRPGGRTARTTAAVYDAAIAELGERAYEQVSVESIAQRAGVHKTTIYRRWSSKERVIADALQGAARDRIDVPDTGAVEKDLQHLAASVRTILASREGAAAARALATGAASSPEIRAVVRDFWRRRMTHVRPIVERAVARGELPPGTNGDELLKHLSAPLYQRLLVTLEPLTTEAAGRAAHATVAAARAGAFVE
jgi:AcrR family transcriptional regulator